MAGEIPWEKSATGARLLCQSIIAKCAIFSEAADVETAHLYSPSTRGVHGYGRRNSLYTPRAPRADGRSSRMATYVLPAWFKT